MLLLVNGSLMPRKHDNKVFITLNTVASYIVIIS